MLVDESDKNVSAFLTSKEISEISKLRQDSAVIGYVLVSPDGEQIEANGVPDNAAAVFANIFDMSASIGAEFGEDSEGALIILESKAVEVICIGLSSAKAVIFRRTASKSGGGLRSVI